MKHTIYCAFLMYSLSLLQVAHAVQCPPGQEARQTGRVVSAVRTLVVPGTASGMFSGIVMSKGIDYDITAAGSIRVGVFGESGTPPEGWQPQGSAGPGFPSPEAYTFSLIYRKGRAGPWIFAGPGPKVLRLSPADPDRVELWFAINDTKTTDNSGSFDVTVKEIVITTQCLVRPSVTSKPRTGYTRTLSGKSGTASKHGATLMTKLPCEGKTPDGLRQGFVFGEYCPGVSTTKPIPVEACSYAEGRELAKELVNFGCHLAETN